MLQKLLKTFCFQRTFIRYASRNSKASHNAAYCMNIVEKSNYENYLELLLLPEFARTPAFAISAFNVQIAQVFDVTKDPNIARMRLQFWHDTVDLCCKNTPPKQPVAEELANAITAYNLSKFHFRRLIAGRQVLLQNQIFRSSKDLDNYAEDTVVPFYLLLLEIYGQTTNRNSEQVANHIGKAKNIVNILRSVAYHANRGDVLIPLDLLVKFKVSEEDIIRGSRENRVKDLVRELATKAKDHLHTARDMKRDVPRGVNHVFLCTVAIEKYLNQLESLGYDVFDGKLRLRNHLLPAHLMLRKIKGGY